MAYKSFEDLDVWLLSMEMVEKIYAHFRECRDFGFKDQICRAAVSVPSNIAEGMERDSKKETVHFLHIAKGSCAELRTQIIISVRIGYVDEDRANLLLVEAESISRMLHGLIKFILRTNS